MVKSRSVVFSTKRKLGHGVAFYKTLALGAHSIAKNAICQTKNKLVALPPLPKLFVKFQRNRLPNVQDIKFFGVRPPPKFCLINLFMSSLSLAALSQQERRENIRMPRLKKATKKKKSKAGCLFTITFGSCISLGLCKHSLPTLVFPHKSRLVLCKSLTAFLYHLDGHLASCVSRVLFYPYKQL